MRTLCAALLIVLAVGLLTFATEELNVYFIDVGQGDAILIDYGMYEMLIDGGRGKACVSFLEETRYIDGSLEVLVATHPDADHIGALNEILDTFEVDTIITNDAGLCTTAYPHFYEAALAERCSCIAVSRNNWIRLGDLIFTVLHPDRLTGDKNEDSLVLLLELESISFLFTGDIESGTEAELLKLGYLNDIDVLKVAHHGSKYSSTSTFLQAVQPELAIYSASKTNSYGHPSRDALSNLAAVGATILGTDEDGTIRVASDGTTWKAFDQEDEILAMSEDSKTVYSTELTLVLEFVNPTGQGRNATLTARTTPGATCSIVVNYKSGPSNASGLETKTADVNGRVSWTWKVGPRTTPGSYRIDVIAVLGDDCVVERTWFTVQNTGNSG